MSLEGHHSNDSCLGLMEESGQLCVSGHFMLEKVTMVATQQTGGLVGPRTNEDDCKEKKILRLSEFETPLVSNRTRLLAETILAPNRIS